MADGAVIRVRRHGNPGGPRLVLSHGNGLAIDGYLPFWRPLLPRYDVIVFDLRHHGQNPPNRAAGHDRPALVADLERVRRAVAERLGARPAAGVFHSLSANVAILHAARFGPRFDALVLFDPPLCPPDGHPLRALQGRHMGAMAARARRRSERYRSPAELARRLAATPRFALWPPEAHGLMARATLRRDTAAGRWRLACPRELEARMYETNLDASPWLALKTLRMPAKLICADPHHPHSDLPALAGAALARETEIAYEAIPGTTHFLQIERPAECICAMETFLERYGLAAPRP